MKKINSKGFGFVGVLAVIVVLAATGGAGAYVYHKNHKAKATTSSNVSSSIEASHSGSSSTRGSSSGGSSSVVASADGKIQVALPDDWKVDSQYLNNKAAVIGQGTKAACVNINDPNPCMYQANFLPTVITSGTYGSLTSGANPASNNSWSLTVEKTRWTMDEAIQQVGGFSQADLIAENNNPINGYTAHFMKGYYAVPHTNQSGMAFYLIEHDGCLAVFSEQIQPVNNQTNPITLGSPYDAEFAKIAQSIKFN